MISLFDITALHVLVVR